MQVRGEQLAEEHAEMVALGHELNQRDRELSRRATEQATEAANTQVQHPNAPPTPSPTQPLPPQGEAASLLQCFPRL